MRINNISIIAAMALGGLVACSTLATAQDAPKDAPKGKRGPPSVEQQMERMTTELTLTDEQKPKVKAVLEETSKKRQELAPEDRRAKMPALMEEQSAKLKEILTPEQNEKWLKMRSEFRKKGGGGPLPSDSEKKSEPPKKD